ncbi:GAF domain-containing protein [Cellulomonas fimi]|uniref:GAF domain-containing protein n=1 Tax=Cellulomonas fimi TaxID=1708 RepID=A0A7Y0LXQ6_CELFI|nr:GAF domain-containing protein [Cellulomonas fimi]NMR20108.1 GAF domain-containing protein [Cellulomonas fimi]
MSDMTHHALDGFAKGAAGRLGPDSHCSIILRHRSHLTYVGSSDERAERCDAVEVRVGAGPCVTAMNQLSSVLVPDVQSEERWPEWRDAALGAGFLSAAALPAYVDEDTTVALNMYSDLLDPWDRDSLIGMDRYVHEIAEAVRTRL